MPLKERAGKKVESEKIRDESSRVIDAGSQLREERLRQGITFEEVTAAIGVRPLILKAIEDNDRQNLPAEVFVRGLIKLYADYLGINTAAILATYANRPVPPEPEDLSAHGLLPDILKLNKETREPLLTISPAKIGWSIAALVVVMVALYVGKHDTVRPTSPQFQEQGITVTPAVIDPVLPQNDLSDIRSALGDPVLSPDLAETENESSEVSVPSLASGTPPDSSVGTSPAVEPPLVVAPAIDEQPVKSPPIGSAPIEAPAVTPPVDSKVTNVSRTPDSGKTEEIPPAYVLELTFIEDTWLEVTIDDQPPRDGIYRKGSHRVWTATKQIDLYLGNAGGVELIFNKWNLPKLGPSGQTKRLSFPRDLPGPRP